MIQVYLVFVADGECSHLKGVFPGEEQALELARTLLKIHPPRHWIVVEIAPLGKLLEGYNRGLEVFKDQGQLPTDTHTEDQK